MSAVDGQAGSDRQRGGFSYRSSDRHVRIGGVLIGGG
jgi:hypothetical protein